MASDRGVEALEVADLEDAVVLLGEGDEGVGFGEGGGDRFFDEAVDQQLVRDRRGGGWSRRLRRRRRRRGGDSLRLWLPCHRRR
jgi:hypothetical protein